MKNFILLIFIINCSFNIKEQFIYKSANQKLPSITAINERYIADIYGQYGLDNKDIWGIGIISNSIRNKSESINFPDTVINVYDIPNGLIIGKIIKQKNGGYYNIQLELKDSNEKFQITIQDLIEIYYEGTCLKYYEKKNNFIQCLLNLRNGGVWISIDDLTKNGFSPIDWTTFLLATKTTYFSILSKGDLVFDEMGNVIDTLKIVKNYVRLINKADNGYVKVKIFSSEKTDDNISKTGWIKIIDEKGHPTIFFGTRGL
jgi:hypothetical protein